MIFALVGNQNCGKTTLFNALTGSNQHVGNFPGVTVDQKMGEIIDEKGCSVVDLPGIYSLRPYTQEVIVSRDFILNQKPDGIINIVDATNIERNLYLTLQLLELRIPMVLALNMMDEVRSNGGSIDVQKMSASLGIPVVPIAAAKGEGVSELVNQAIAVARSRTLPKVTDFCADDSAVHRCIHAVTHLIADHADRIGVPARFCAAKLIEGGDDLADRLALDQNERELLEHCIVQMESEAGLDRNAALADMRYTFIEGVVASSVVKCHESREHARSMKIDRILTGRYTAIPTFLLVMLLIFYLTFNVIGQRLSDWLQGGIDGLTFLVDQALTAYEINPVVHSLIIDGIFSGVDFLYIRNNSFRLMINNLLLFSWPAVGIENSQSGVQIRSLVKTAFQPVCLKPCLFKNFSVRKKINLCSSLLCPSQSRKKAIFQGNYRNPPFIGIVMNITVFINLHIHPGR